MMADDALALTKANKIQLVAYPNNGFFQQLNDRYNRSAMEEEVEADNNDE